VVAWNIGVEISGVRVDQADLARLVAVFEREFSDFEAKCALWSGRLGVHGMVTSRSPIEALTSALTRIEIAFDQADVDTHRVSQIANVTIRRVMREDEESDVSDAESLARALFRRVSPSRQR
jgi:hypothetical protein